MTDLVINLMSRLLPATPESLIYRIRLKFEETRLLQQLWLGHLAATREIGIDEAQYSFLKGDGVDGVLLYLLARGGFTNRVSVDIGAGDGVIANTANLVLFHRFRGFMVDGSSEDLEIGRRTYDAIRPVHPPVLIHAMVNSGNVSDILQARGVPETVDVLSIDIDSVDLYVVRDLSIRARIVVVEFNNLWGPDEPFSVPDVHDFRRELGEFLYGGASLAAFDKILSVKGYKLVGIASSGFDAFFVLDEPSFVSVPAVSLQSLYEGSPGWRESHRRSVGHEVRTRSWVRI